MKHVVFAHRKLSFGGGEKVLLEQVAALAELPVKVDILFRKDPHCRDLEPELRKRNPNVGAILHVPGTLAAYRWLRRAQPDLLVLCNHKGVQRALPWLARLGQRIPTVVTLHEHYPRHLNKYRGIRKHVDRWIITWDFAEAVRAHLGPQPTHLIHPLYPRRALEAPDEEARKAARQALGLAEAGCVVGYVGQIDGRKDPVATLQFAEYLETALGQPVQLVFAGREESDTAQALGRAVEASPLKDRIRRLGRVQAIAPVLDALDLYAMTSRNEGYFPLALIEALERGVPVLAPTVGGIGTVLREGEGGFRIQRPDDRRPVTSEALRDAAERVAAVLGQPEAWASQRSKAHALSTELTHGYDAAARFRAAVAAWLP